MNKVVKKMLKVFFNFFFFLENLKQKYHQRTQSIVSTQTTLLIYIHADKRICFYIYTFEVFGIIFSILKSEMVLLCNDILVFFK